MDNKFDLADLMREKRELDSFLSTIAGVEASAPIPVKAITQKKEAASSESENKSVLKDSYQEPAGLKLEKPDIKPEELFKPAAHKDKLYAQSVNEFIPRGANEVSSKSSDRFDSFQERKSSSISFDDEKKTDFRPRVTSAKNVRPLESMKTMTRFDGTMKSETPSPGEAPPPEEKKPSMDVREEDKKISTTGSYDFEPEKKSTGKGKWIWILIILLILLLIGGYFFLSPKLSMPDFGSIFQFKGSSSVSSVKEIRLLNVRQRLVYNNQLGKSVRVIEGVAENIASYPVSKIKVVANLYNANGSVIASRESFAGNILIDSKLESLDDAGLVSEINSGKTSEDIIPPKGQTPFMLVFTTELKGVHRMSVVPVDFSKH